MPALFIPEERWGAGSWRQNHPFTVDAQIDHGLQRRRLRLLGLLALQRPRGRLRRVRRRRDRDGPERLSVQRGPHAGRRRVRGLPRRGARAAAVRLHERRRDAARRGARAALPAGRGDGQPRAARADPGHVRQVGLRGLGERPEPARLRELPVARPGHDHGGGRQRARAATCCASGSPPRTSGGRSARCSAWRSSAPRRAVARSRARRATTGSPAPRATT